LGDALNPTSLQKIQQLEGIDKFPHLEYPEQDFAKPTWVKTFENVDLEDEGGIIVLEGYVDPADDPNMKVFDFLQCCFINYTTHFRSNGSSTTCPYKTQIVTAVN
jgi:hypothetical protein